MYHVGDFIQVIPPRTIDPLNMMSINDFIRRVIAQRSAAWRFGGQPQPATEPKLDIKGEDLG
jgi:hypothetical protein